MGTLKRARNSMHAEWPCGRGGAREWRCFAGWTGCGTAACAAGRGSHASTPPCTAPHLDGQVEAAQLVARQRVGAAAHDDGARLVQLHHLLEGRKGAGEEAAGCEVFNGQLGATGLQRSRGSWIVCSPAVLGGMAATARAAVRRPRRHGRPQAQTNQCPHLSASIQRISTFTLPTFCITGSYTYL